MAAAGKVSKWTVELTPQAKKGHELAAKSKAEELKRLAVSVEVAAALGSGFINGSNIRMNARVHTVAKKPVAPIPAPVDLKPRIQNTTAVPPVKADAAAVGADKKHVLPLPIAAKPVPAAMPLVPATMPLVSATMPPTPLPYIDASVGVDSPANSSDGAMDNGSDDGEQLAIAIATSASLVASAKPVNPTKPSKPSSPDIKLAAARPPPLTVDTSMQNDAKVLARRKEARLAREKGHNRSASHTVVSPPASTNTPKSDAAITTAAAAAIQPSPAPATLAIDLVGDNKVPVMFIKIESRLGEALVKVVKEALGQDYVAFLKSDKAIEMWIGGAKAAKAAVNATHNKPTGDKQRNTRPEKQRNGGHPANRRTAERPTSSAVAAVMAGAAAGEY